MNKKRNNDVKNVNGVKGMHVLELLNTFDDETVIFVGSKSAYFYIGTVREFRENIESISTELLLLSAGRNIRSFVPLYERKVKEVYRRFQGDGISIILYGNEHGSYWTADESKRNIPPLQHSRND